MHTAAVQLTCTVDKQVSALSTMVERLEIDLQNIVLCMQTWADADKELGSVQYLLVVPEPTAKVLKSYATAVAQVLLPAVRSPSVLRTAHHLMAPANHLHD
jgi:hypothetical protein